VKNDYRLGALPLLRDLVNALDGAFISSWQTTAGWQKELDEARAFIEGADALKDYGK
jgi:hypothetical protein